MKVLQIAILGTWVKPERFGNLINEYEGCSVSAVWDPVYANAKRVAAALGSTAIEDLDQILNDPKVDGVVIVTENYLRAELILKAVAAGKHIFVEKPFCINMEDAYLIREKVKQSKVKFFMSDPFVGASTIYQKQLMQEGRLGRILNARLRFCLYHPYEGTLEECRELTEKTGGGMMSDLGGHALHIIYYLFGLPEKVEAHFAYIDPIRKECGYEDYISLLMVYKEGFTVSAECSLMAPDCNSIEVTGTKGMSVNTGPFSHDRSIKYFVSDKAEGNWITPPDSDLPENPDTHVIYWLRMILEDISQEDFARDPKGTTGLSIDGAVALLKLREAIYASAKN